MAWGAGLRLQTRVFFHWVALALWVPLFCPVPGRRHPLAEETWHEAPVASGSDPVGSTPSGLEREDQCSRDLDDSRQPLISKCGRRATLSVIQGRGYLQTEASPHGSDPYTIVYE